jgi:hypothetical protein
LPIVKQLHLPNLFGNTQTPISTPPPHIPIEIAAKENDTHIAKQEIQYAGKKSAS